MFPFLAIFIIFCIVLAYYIRKDDSSQKKVMDDFWDKERQANAVRKKDISNLDYITIPLDKIPQKLCTSVETSLFELAEKPMVNFTGISNTDLKLEYGTANLAILSEYDANFIDMVALLPKYVNELLDAGQVDSAQMLLEFAVDANADSRIIYQQLISIYKDTHQEEKIEHLWEASEQLPELTKKAIQKDLSAMN